MRLGLSVSLANRLVAAAADLAARTGACPWAVFFALLSAAAAYAADISWTNPSGGAWSNSANWSTGVVPGPADRALIELAGNYTVRLDVDAAIAGLTLGGSSGHQIFLAVARTLSASGTVSVAPSGVFRLFDSSMN